MSQRGLFKLLGICAISGLVGFSAALAQAAPALKVGKLSTVPGAIVDLPVDFEAGGAAVASLQFELTLPDNVETVSVTAQKSLSTADADKSVTQRLKGKTLICLVYGINQNKISSKGLVTVKLKIAPKTALGTIKIPVSNVVFSDPSGHTVAPGHSSGGSIKVKSPEQKS